MISVSALCSDFVCYTYSPKNSRVKYTWRLLFVDHRLLNRTGRQGDLQKQQIYIMTFPSVWGHLVNNKNTI